MTRKAPVAAANPVNPAHHKGFIGERQWAENYAIRLRARHSVEMVQEVIASWGDKYIDRVGRKDPPVQELKKSMWYLRYAATLSVTNDPTNLVPFQRSLDGTLDDEDYPVVEQRLGRPQARASAEATLAALCAFMTDLREQPCRNYTRECVAIGYAIALLEGKEPDSCTIESILLSDTK